MTQTSTVRANYTETTDAPNDLGTPYSMSAGDTFSGGLTTGDFDLVAVDLVAGQTYEFTMTAGTMDDPYLSLYDSSTTSVAVNDDWGGTTDSLITYTPSTSGTYYLQAGAFSATDAGSYTLAVTESGSGGGGGGGSSSSPEGSLDDLANYLTTGYWQDNGQGVRSFDTSSSNVITVNISGLTPAGQQLARWAFEAWERVADIDFVVTTGAADITFQDHESGAWSSTSYDGSGNIVSSTVNVSTGWLSSYGSGIDSYSYSTYIHEIGHAIGLGHQGNYDGNATFGVHEEFSNDSYQMSVMSYFSQTDNPNVDASYGEPITPMMADIVAIQTLYGAPGASSDTSGNTTWGGTGSSFGGYLGDYFDTVAGDSSSGNYGGNPVVLTIYDRDGTDTFDLTWSTDNDRVDMRATMFSDIAGQTGNVGIARGTVIENMMAGSGSDHVTGNFADNTIYGNNGNDTIYGLQGWDTLRGGNGNDVVYGGNGRDRTYLGNGADTYSDTGQGGNYGRDTVFGGNGEDTIRGGGGDDRLNGERQADYLVGGDGNDTVTGGFGRDVSYLGNGNDLYTDVGQNDAFGADYVFGGNGEDTIKAGGGADTLAGGNGNDEITGGWGNDSLMGGNHADTIFAGAHDDTVIGGNGTDTAYLGTGNDVFIDATQTGAFGSDIIDGGDGNDTITISGGNDTITGGAGADVFIFDSSNTENDVITDYEVGVDTLDFAGGDVIGAPVVDGAQIVADYATVTADGVLFDFGNGNTILLEGLTTTAGLAADITTDLFS